MAKSSVSGPFHSANGFVGNLTGDVTGNVTGDIAGNITGNVTGNLTGNVGDTTSAEIALQCDVSANTETIDSGEAASVTKRITLIDNTASGAGAITLDAPDATMVGAVKIIEMVVDNGDVTLSLANVQGGSADTTATFAAVGDTLVLVAGTTKWHVIGESGVVLSS